MAIVSFDQEPAAGRCMNAASAPRNWRLRRNTLTFILTLAFGTGYAFSASAAAMPDGTYRCQMYSGSIPMHLGDIEIRGNTYKGPAYDGDYEGAYEYQLTERGTIDWNGPMGGLDSGGNAIVSTVAKDNGGTPSFDFTLQLESGSFSTVSCSL